MLGKFRRSYTVECVQEMLFPNGFKVTETRNDRYLLTEECQADEILKLEVTVLRYHCLKPLELMI